MLLVLGVARVITTDQHNTLPINQVEKKLAVSFSCREPELVLVGKRSHSSGGHIFRYADLLLVNPMNVPIEYKGYRMDSWQTRPPVGEISPFYSLQIQTAEDKTWHNGSIGWCGTGAGKMTVPPKHVGRFAVHIDPRGTSAKISLKCSWTDSDGKRNEPEIVSQNLLGETEN